MNQLEELKIFVVDNNPVYLNILVQHISNLGCEKITTFNNGTDCLNSIAEKPDIVFLNYKMDTLTGYDVLKKIKRHYPDIHVIIVSGQKDIRVAVAVLKYGAFDYIQKGDSEDKKIKDALRRVLQVKDLLRQSKPSFLKKLLYFF